MTYYLLQAILKDCIRDFFFLTINLFSLIYGESVLLYYNTKIIIISQ